MSQHDTLTQALQGLLDSITNPEAGEIDRRLAIKDARAALSATQPAHDDGWLQDRGLLYRLTDGRRPHNRDEIKVTMADGSRSDESCSRRAGELLDRIRATQPAAGADVLETIATVRESYRATDWGKAAECICDAIYAAIAASGRPS